MTTEQRAEMRRLVETATPGPWKADDSGYSDYIFGPDCAMVADACHACEGVRIRGVGGRLPMGINKEFVAAARTFIPDALTALDEKDAEIARLTNERDGWKSQWTWHDAALNSAKANAAHLEARWEALKPSAELKGALIGEFSIDSEERQRMGEPPTNIPWTAIKDILAKAREFAERRASLESEAR